MTDASSYPLKPINGADFSRASLANATLSPPLSHNQNNYAVQEEDDGLISCFCGFSDDDGATVCCDLCNTWQHISCYYPDLAGGLLPDDIQHFCVNCKPRSVDRASARQIQKQRQEHQRHQQREELHHHHHHDLSVNGGAKRGATKGHKKKNKDNNNNLNVTSTTSLTNGWSLDPARHDRNSDSPREQGPPAKRPRTSHRHSDSTTSTNKGHSRKRNVSSVQHRRSPSRSSDIATDRYSEEFLRCHLHDQWTTTKVNLCNSLAVRTELSAWLSMPDDEFQNLYGLQKHEVFNRWDRELDDIPGRAEIEIQDDCDETVRFGDGHPSWKKVTVQMPIADGAYIGELKGHIDFKDAYQADPANRWAQLRHPEPFVFFHPNLPVYIDARNEGTNLRYIRRSCVPNARLQILVTDQTDYRFCFMATKQIDPGEEIAVSWDLAVGLPKSLIGVQDVSPENMAVLSDLVSTVLANCGPCACPPETDCKMSRFDRRGRDRTEEMQPIKMPKTKKRRTGQHVSPLNTNALNSRSGSEVRKVDPDEDAIESRSASGSVGQRRSVSRDNTPHMHGLANGTTEMSERERKKLAKEEEMFRRQEEEQTGKQAKKKRNSAGSNLTTPTAAQTPSASTGSKPFSFPVSQPTGKQSDAGTSTRQSSVPSRSGASRRPRTTKTPSRTPGRVVKRTKPVYVDATTQCDMDADEHCQAARPVSPEIPRRKYITARQHLLELCARNNNHRHRSWQSSVKSSSSPSPVDVPTTSMSEVTAKVEDDNTTPDIDVKMANPAEDDVHVPAGPQADDIEMEDVPSSALPTTASPMERSSPLIPTSEVVDDDNTATPAIEPPEPPWTDEAQTSQRLSGVHLEMPPPFIATARPGSSSSGSGIVQSPAAIPTASTPGGPLFSPSVITSVSTPAQQSPATKKKLSLSDYTRRNKVNRENEATSKAERESSPASSVSAAPATTTTTTNMTTTTNGSGGSIPDRATPLGGVSGVDVTSASERLGPLPEESTVGMEDVVLSSSTAAEV